MSEHIKVNTVRLKNDASNINNRITKIEKMIQDLKSHKNALDAMWDGPSSEAFKTSFTQDILDLEELVKSLKKLNEYEDYAREEYEGCERKVSDLIDQIRIR